ncbi:hypothetical protein [Actinoalloteichus caeruleus]|uniref:hypothetical protein n=1 Tax=Actinoalloteichus cyanogriseus TaxID=2893586 RepID=UPI0012DC8531|nr:hypothetical protein [Actinoalloteichus caeruleus]
MVLAPPWRPSVARAPGVPSFDLLRVPVLAVGGEDDPLCTVDGLRGWARRTDVRCRVCLWPGGHTVTEERVTAIGDAIRAELDRR